MHSVQTLVWLSGTPVTRVLEHTDEEWIALIRRQLRAEKERKKNWLDEKKRKYAEWTKTYDDYVKWCESHNKKPSALNHLKYKFRNKKGMTFPWMKSRRTTDDTAFSETTDDTTFSETTDDTEFCETTRGCEDNTKAETNNSTEKANEYQQQEQAESPQAEGAATSDTSKPSSSKSGKSISEKVKQAEVDAADKPSSATEHPATNTSTDEQFSKNEQRQNSVQPETADVATDTVNVAKDVSDDEKNAWKTDHDEAKAASLTLELEIEELKKQIAILTMKIGDGVK